MLNNGACVCVAILVSGLMSAIQQKGIAEELLYIDKHIEIFNYYCSVGGLEIDEDQSVLYVVQLFYCM